MKRFLTFMLALLMLLSLLPSALADSPHTHKWIQVSYTYPTCTQPGEAVYICSCGERKTETIPALGHDFYEKVYTGQADCTHYGVFYWVCFRCGAHSDTGNDLPLGHDWKDEGVMTKSPTATEEGELTYRCKRNSSHTKTEPIPALGPVNPALKLTVSPDYKLGYEWDYYEYYLGATVQETLTNTGDIPLLIHWISKEYQDVVLQPNEQLSFSKFIILQGIAFEHPADSSIIPGDITYDVITYTPDDPKYIGYYVSNEQYKGYYVFDGYVDYSEVDPLCVSNMCPITIRIPNPDYEEVLSGFSLMKTEAHGPANGEYYEPGETIDYVITLTNDSENDLSNLAVYDSLAGFEPIAAVESLAQGEILKFEYSTIVTEEEVTRARAVNSAVVTFNYGNDVSATPRFSNWVYSKTSGAEDAAAEIGHFDVTKLDVIPEYTSEAEAAAVTEQWFEAAQTWNAEAEKLYAALWDAGDDLAKSVIIEERAMFYSWLEAVYDDMSADTVDFRQFRAEALYTLLSSMAAADQDAQFIPDISDGIADIEYIAETLRLKCISLRALINSLQ